MTLRQLVLWSRFCVSIQAAVVCLQVYQIIRELFFLAILIDVY